MRGAAPSLWCSALGRAAASVQVRENRVLVHSFPGRPDKVQMFGRIEGWLGICPLPSPTLKSPLCPHRVGYNIFRRMEEEMW